MPQALGGERTNMYYVYVLYSKKDRKFYIGLSEDLQERLREHKKGQTFAGSRLRDWRLVYYEVCLSKEDAALRERQLKTGFGRGYLRRRLKTYLMRA